MLNHYFDLKDQTKLPPNSKFIDPYDHTTFTVKPGDTLSSFIKQLQDYRASQNYPIILEDDFRQLVVSSLFESTPKQHIQTYFEERSALPSLSQLISVSKVVAREAIHSNNVSGKQKRERALKCLDSCKFHRNTGGWNKGAVKAVLKVAGLKDAASSPEEQAVGTCMMCGGCSLSGKLKFTTMAVLAGLTPDKLDNMLRLYGVQSFEKCWIFNEALQESTTKELLKKKMAAGKANGLQLYNEYLSQKVKQSKV